MELSFNGKIIFKLQTRRFQLLQEIITSEIMVKILAATLERRMFISADSQLATSGKISAAILLRKILCFICATSTHTLDSSSAASTLVHLEIGIG